MASNERSIEYNLRYYQSNLEPNVEMAISIQDKQKVFLAYRALFEGQNSHVRQPKVIRKILTSSSKKPASPLVKGLGLDKVVAVLKELLESGVFLSELKAKLAFPVLYETSPEQEARHEASDAGAARDEAEALQEVEASDEIPVEVPDAETFEDENARPNKSSKLSAGIQESNGLAANSRGKTLLRSENSKLKTTQDRPSLRRNQMETFPHSIQSNFLSNFSIRSLSRSRRYLKNAVSIFLRRGRLIC